MSDVFGADYDAVLRTADDAIAALLSTDPREKLFIPHPYLAGSCEPVSIAIAVALEDRGLGTWTFVQASRPGEANGHAWLEWRRGDGEALFSIDATLQQMPGHLERFIGEGPTPASAEFSVVNYAGPIWDWQWLRTGSNPYTRVVEAVRSQLAQRHE